MDETAKAIEELSLVVNNFSVGAVRFNSKICKLHNLEESFKLKKSLSLLGQAYREHQFTSINNEEGFTSTLSMQAATILEREKIVIESQQLALRGLVEKSAIESLFQTNEFPDTFKEIKCEISSITNKLINEYTKNTDLSNDKVFDDLLLKEKLMIKESQQFRDALNEFNDKKEGLSKSTASHTKLIMQRVSKLLEQVNFMRRLIVSLVGAMDVNLIEQKEIADIVLHKCKPLLLRDLNV